MDTATQSNNPSVTLRDFLKSEIAKIEAKGKTPKTLHQILDLFRPVMESGNQRVRSIKTLRAFIQERLADAESKSKPTKNLTMILAMLNDVASINHTTMESLLSRIGELESEKVDMGDQIASLKAAIASEPVKQILNIRRQNVSMVTDNALFDAIPVSSKPEDVASRLAPIVHHADGVIGFAVMFSHEVLHYFYFHRFATQLEIARGETIDLDGNPSDGLLVYQHTLNAAVTLANAYTEILGPLNSVVAQTRNQLENLESSTERVVPNLVTAEGAIPSFFNEDSDSSEDSEDVDADSDNEGEDEDSAGTVNMSDDEDEDVDAIDEDEG